MTPPTTGPSTRVAKEKAKITMGNWNRSLTKRITGSRHLKLKSRESRKRNSSFSTMMSSRRTRASPNWCGQLESTLKAKRCRSTAVELILLSSPILPIHMNGNLASMWPHLRSLSPTVRRRRRWKTNIFQLAARKSFKEPSSYFRGTMQEHSRNCPLDMPRTTNQFFFTKGSP